MRDDNGRVFLCLSLYSSFFLLWMWNCLCPNDYVVMCRCVGDDEDPDPCTKSDSLKGTGNPTRSEADESGV